MGLRSVDTSSLPERSSTGGQTSVPKDEQAQLLELLTSGQSASDGKTYESGKLAAKAAGPYRRFVKSAIKRGEVAGATRLVTFNVDKKGNPDAEGELRAWALYLVEASEGDEAETAE